MKPKSLPECFLTGINVWLQKMVSISSRNPCTTSCVVRFSSFSSRESNFSAPRFGDVAKVRYWEMAVFHFSENLRKLQWYPGSKSSYWKAQVRNHRKCTSWNSSGRWHRVGTVARSLPLVLTSLGIAKCLCPTILGSPADAECCKNNISL